MIYANHVLQFDFDENKSLPNCNKFVAMFEAA